MISKKFLLIFLILGIISSVFSASPNDYSGLLSSNGGSSILSSFFAKFGDFYDSISTNENILNGIGFLMLVVGFYSIFLNLTQFAFKGDKAGPARKGSSILLSFMVSSALVFSTQSLVKDVGGMILFLFFAIGLIGGMIAYVKFIIDKVKMLSFRIFYAAIGVIILDLLLKALAKTFIGTLTKGTFTYTVISIFDYFASVAFTVSIFALIFGLFKLATSGPSSKEENKEYTEEEKEDKKNLNEVKSLTKQAADSLKQAAKVSKEKTDVLGKIQKEILHSTDSTMMNSKGGN